MRQFRLVFLLFVALLCSGYKFRCYIFCEEQTAVQNDYIEQRDDCRYYAQKNINSEMANTQSKNSGAARKIKLVELFSDCMNRYGWDVPSGSSKRHKFANNEAPLYVASVSSVAAPQTSQNSVTSSQAGSTASSSRVVAKPYKIKQKQKVYSRDVFARSQYKQKNPKQLSKLAPAAGSQKKSTITTIKKRQQKPYRDVFAKNKYKKKTTKKVRSASALQKKTVVNATKRKSSAHQTSSKNIDKQKITNTTVRTAKKQNTNLAKTQSQPKVTAKKATIKKVAGKNPKQLSKLAPAAGVATAPKTKTRAKREFECKTARRFAATSKKAAIMAKECKKECAEQSKNAPKGKIPTVCPKVKSKNKTTKQLGKLAPAAGVVTAPKTKVKTGASRAFECRGARRFTTISKKSANLAKECKEECDSLLKKYPEGKRPAACPKLESTNKTPTKKLNKIASVAGIQKKSTIKTIKQKQKTSNNKVSPKNTPKYTTIKNTSKTTNKKNVYTSKTQSQPKTTTKQIKQKTTKQLSRLAPAAGVTTIPKDKAKTGASRAFECKVARRFAATSVKASSMAKACKIECTKRSKNAPKDKIPAACPNQNSTRKHLGVSPTTVQKKQKKSNYQPYSESNNKRKTPKQLSKLSPAAGATTSTKGKEMARSKRAFECEIARNSAATSNSAAKLAKDCRKECNRLLKNTVNGRKPAACPKNRKATGSVVNLLDTQLKGKK